MSNLSKGQEERFYAHIIKKINLRKKGENKFICSHKESRSFGINDLYQYFNLEVLNYVGKEFNELRMHFLGEHGKVNSSIFDDFAEFVLNYFEEQSRAMIPEGYQGLVDGDDMVIIDIQTNDHYLYKAKTDTFTTISTDALSRMLNQIGKKLSDIQTDFCHVKYDPTQSERFYSIEIKNHHTGNIDFANCFNLYSPPSWRIGLEANNNPPKLFNQILKTLVPNESDRIVLVAWLYQAIFKARASTVLTVKGALGAGKNLILEGLLEQLVGIENYAKANASFFEKEFNSVMKNTKVVFVDEVGIKKETDKNKLKSYLNDRISVEEKGRNAETIVNTTSIIVTSNHLDDMEVLSNDRRFTAIRITDVQEAQNKFVGEENIEKFMLKVKNNIDYLKSIASYIKYVGENYEFRLNGGNWKKFTPHTVIRNNAFWRLVYNSMKSWQRQLIHNGLHEYKIKKVTGSNAPIHKKFHQEVKKKKFLYGDKNAHGGSIPGDSTFKKFLDEHRSPKGEPLATIEIDDSDLEAGFVEMFKYNEKYLAEYNDIYQSSYESCGDVVEVRDELDELDL